MKIIVNMACGLANRMFQYSYYLFLKKNGYDASVDFYQSAKLAHEKVSWNDIFPVAKINQASRTDIFWLGGGDSFFSKVRRKFFPALCRVVNMPTAFDAPLPVNDGSDKYLIGVFQNAASVEAVEEEVRACFSFVPFSDNFNIGVEQELRECMSVGIHVRKGKDYMSRIWYQDTCSVKYYRDAITKIRELVDNPKFFVFTDNPQWVKENFTDIDYCLIEGNPADGWGSHFDMQLMSLCKHNIISNSTYSWWGAFLNENKNKIVICPEIWFNPASCEEYTSDRLLCKNWIAI